MSSLFVCKTKTAACKSCTWGLEVSLKTSGTEALAEALDGYNAKCMLNGFVLLLQVAVPAYVNV